MDAKESLRPRWLTVQRSACHWLALLLSLIPVTATASDAPCCPHDVEIPAAKELLHPRSVISFAAFRCAAKVALLAERDGEREVVPVETALRAGYFLVKPVEALEPEASYVLVAEMWGRRSELPVRTGPDTPLAAPSTRPEAIDLYITGSAGPQPHAVHHCFTRPAMPAADLWQFRWEIQVSDDHGQWRAVARRPLPVHEGAQLCATLGGGSGHDGGLFTPRLGRFRFRAALVRVDGRIFAGRAVVVTLVDPGHE